MLRSGTGSQTRDTGSAGAEDKLGQALSQVQLHREAKRTTSISPPDQESYQSICLRHCHQYVMEQSWSPRHPCLLFQQERLEEPTDQLNPVDVGNMAIGPPFRFENGMCLQQGRW